jgi:hypothetical protein
MCEKCNLPCFLKGYFLEVSAKIAFLGRKDLSEE